MSAPPGQWTNTGDPEGKQSKHAKHLMLHYLNSGITFLLGVLFIIFGVLGSRLVFGGDIVGRVDKYYWVNIIVGVSAGSTLLGFSILGCAVKGQLKLIDHAVCFLVAIGLIIVAVMFMLATNTSPSDTFQADYTAAKLESDYPSLEQRYNKGVESGSHSFAFSADKIEEQLLNTFVGSNNAIGMGIWSVKAAFDVKQAEYSDAYYCTEKAFRESVNQKFPNVCLAEITDTWNCPAMAALCLNNITLYMLHRQHIDGILWIIGGVLVILNAAFGTWVTVKLDPNPRLSKMYVQNTPQYGSTGHTDANQQWQQQGGATPPPARRNVGGHQSPPPAQRQFRGQSPQEDFHVGYAEFDETPDPSQFTYEDMETVNPNASMWDGYDEDPNASLRR